MSVNDDVSAAVEEPRPGTCTPADDALAEQWHRLMRDYARMSCSLDRALSAHGLTSSEFEVLEQLARARDVDGAALPVTGVAGGTASGGAASGGAACGQVRMSDLAEHVHLSQSALSRLVARLEKDGLAVRSMCESDRRSVFTTITQEGERRYRDARPTHRAVLRAESADCEMREYLCGEA